MNKVIRRCTIVLCIVAAVFAFASCSSEKDEKPSGGTISVATPTPMNPVVNETVQEPAVTAKEEPTASPAPSATPTVTPAPTSTEQPLPPTEEPTEEANPLAGTVLEDFDFESCTNMNELLSALDVADSGAYYYIDSALKSGITGMITAQAQESLLKLMDMYTITCIGLTGEEQQDDDRVHLSYTFQDNIDNGVTLYFGEKGFTLFYETMTDIYPIASYEYTGEEVPDMLLIRKLVFEEEQIDLYAAICTYENEAAEGIYQTGTGYLIDLDGDGAVEKLFVDYVGLEYWNSYGIEDTYLYIGRSETQGERIYINGVLSLVKEYADMPDIMNFNVFNLDSSDSMLEIMTYDNGASDDPESKFYRYIDGNIVYIGNIYDRIRNDYETSGYGPDGSGIIYADMRLSILQTWFTKTSYFINADGMIEHTNEELYYPNLYSRVQILKQELIVYKDRSVSSEKITIPPSQITLPITDNIEWVYVSSSEGYEGWMHLYDGYRLSVEDVPQAEGDMWPGDIIEGLSMAD